MIVKWEMSIGYPGACQQGEIKIDDADLEGKTESEKEAIIGEAIWDDAVQYVDVYPLEEDEE